MADFVCLCLPLFAFVCLCLPLFAFVCFVLVDGTDHGFDL